MGTNLTPYSCADEDYIDMEITSSPSKILCSSSPQTREFEFQMFSTCNDKATTTSPADELFYKGKLLPLHLPPRRQMVEHLLLTSTTTTTTTTFEEDHFYSVPFLTCSTAPCTNTTNTPLDSCNISPSESCRVSCELNPDDTFFEWSNEFSSFIKNHQTKNSWPKKLKQKLINHSILVQKLKSSRAYLKSLFSKSVCSDESSADNLSKADANKYLKIGKKIAAIIKSIDKDGIDENGHRRSFSGAIKRHSPTKCLSSSSSNSSSGSSSSSSSSSFNLNGVHELNFLRRSSNATEIEVSIDAAIAHCKKSMQSFQKRELGFCSLSASKSEDGEGFYESGSKSMRKFKSC